MLSLWIEMQLSASVPGRVVAGTEPIRREEKGDGSDEKMELEMS